MRLISSEVHGSLLLRPGTFRMSDEVKLKLSNGSGVEWLTVRKKQLLTMHKRLGKYIEKLERRGEI